MSARLAMKGKPKVVTTGLGPIGLTAASLVRNIRIVALSMACLAAVRGQDKPGYDLSAPGLYA